MNRELQAVSYALQVFAPPLQDQHFELLIDNVAAAFGLIQLSMRQPLARRQLQEIWERLLALRARMRVRWIAALDNGRADALSRVVDRTDYQLHPRLFGLMCERWGHPQVDAFATALNAQLPTFWAARPEPGAAAVDALAQPVHGLRVYANPPWGLITPWLLRIQAHPSAEARLVLPDWRSAVWYPLLDLADDVLVIRPEHDTFRPGFCANAHGIGRPRWRVLLAHIPPR